MLRPEERHYFSELLSPPPGYQLEKAIGATYSLELPTLLLAPLAMTQRPIEGALQPEGSTSGSEEEQRPVSLIEAIRRTSDRFALFCQRGRIKIPASYSGLYAYLESSIAELNPDEGAFHPKLWILHFTRDTHSRYRLVCTSRNLSYNRTWDTVVALEGDSRIDSGTSAAPLAKFLDSILRHEMLSQGAFERHRLLEQFAEELKDVTFQAPAPFDKATLRFQGWGEAPLLNSQPDGERAVFISPFLSLNTLKRMQNRCASLSASEPTTLVSRQYSLDELHSIESSESRADEAFWKYFECHVLSAGENFNPDEIASDQIGLHAKVYVTETDDRATWRFTSANLTYSGLEGKNVEFGVDLVGPVDRVGIENLLETDDDDNDENFTLGDLLAPYYPPDEPPDLRQAKAERKAEEWRSFFSDGELTLCATPTDTSREYDVELQFTPTRRCPETSIAKVRVWLSSLGRGASTHRLNLNKLTDEISVNLGTFSALSLTPFVAFELVVREPVKHTARFVLGANLEGLEEDRREIAFEQFIRDRSRFLQYLRYLLDDAEDYWVIRTERQTGRSTNSLQRRGDRVANLPLMEDLVRKCVDNERKIEEIHSLLQSVREFDQANEIIPPPFLKNVWLPLLQAVKPELTDEY